LRNSLIFSTVVRILSGFLAIT